jgi:peptidoglycan/xylan/chitin deacetylase (PgdA/CDA1 family)
MGLKTLIYQAAELSGAASALERSEWRRKLLLILCYHGVSVQDEHEWNPDLYVSQDHLRQRLEYLRARKHPILPLTEGLQRLEDGSLPPCAVAVTFDDGTRDFAERAVPLLQAYDVPTTVYQTTYYVDRQLPVFDTTLSYLLWKGQTSRADLSRLTGGRNRLPVTEPRDRRAARQALQWLAGEMTTLQKHELLGRVAEHLGIQFEEFVASGMLQLMTADQIRALPRELVQVELHTHRHRLPREREQFMRELTENQSRIKALTGDDRPRRHFCYPSGDYDGRVLEWLAELGVRSATTCVPGLASAGDHHLLVPRFVDSMSVSRATFAAWTSGAAALLPRRAIHRLDTKRLTVPPDALPNS